MNTCFGNLFCTLIVGLIVFNTSSAIAQCAGTDRVTTICDKEQDPSLQNFDLFTVLTDAMPGGTWIAESNLDSNALNATTGELNLWDINRFGAHLFTYSNPNCDSSSATVTINLGGYPGESSQDFGDNNACQNDPAVNLFSFLDIPDGIRGPDFNGIWAPIDPQLQSRLTDEFFNFVGLPIGTYTFTYTVPAVASCPERSAIIDVELRRVPNSGNAINLSVCETDDLSGLTAVNLFDRLDGSQDPNGVWRDINVPSTGELTSGTDFEINVQDIFTNFGPGSYSYTYTVDPNHPICDASSTTFVVCIERQLILEATLDVECTGMVNINYDDAQLGNGTYTLSYTVTGNSLGNFSGTAINVPFSNGVASFNLFPSLPLNTSENLTLTITDISGGVICENTRLCTPIVTVPPESFDLYVTPTITVSSTTGCALDDILITYANTTDAAFNPIDGMTSVTYAINGTVFTDDVEFVNGNANPRVSIDRFNLGSNQLTFFESNSFIHCGDLLRSSVLNLIPAPPNPIFGIQPDDRCDATNLEFNFDSPSGQFINYSSVTFDIYEQDGAPALFAPRNPNTSLSNNTVGDGIDINITNRNDVSALPDGDYVFVIRSVQDDNAPCRGLSSDEIEGYAAQNISIDLTQLGREHIFDVRLPFRIGVQEPVNLVNTMFEVCLQFGPVTLNDLQLDAGSDVTITTTNTSGDVLPLTYEITQDETFTATFTSSSTNCDLGSEMFNVTVVSQPSNPVLEPYTFCELTNPTVADLEVPNQNITWFTTETGANTYNATDPLNTANAYWAELTITGGCTSTGRTRAVFSLEQQAEAPLALPNNFCTETAPIIDDLNVAHNSAATLTWYTSQTGAAYDSTTLPLETANEYWVTQTLVEGCESERTQVNFTLSDTAATLIPLANVFCTANGFTPTLETLNYQENSLTTAATISYFSDAEGTQPLNTSTTLNTLTSPVFAQQSLGSTCTSPIVEVTFTLETIATAPLLNAVSLCAQSSPTVQDLLDQLQTQTPATLRLYNDASTSVLVDLTRRLETLTTPIFASQTVIAGCESTDRTQVVFNLETPEFPNIDFQLTHCLSEVPTLNALYLGAQTITWFDENNSVLALDTPLIPNRTYSAQLEINGCLTARTPVSPNLITVETPQPSSAVANLCGIDPKTITDLLQDATADRFVIPEDATLVWYDAEDIDFRVLLDTSTILEQGVSYFAVYQTETNGILCESDPVAITVDLTNCDEALLTIPDAFSPNGDRINDTFELQNIAFVFPDYDIEIYNRYGRVLFKGDVSTGFWDGRPNQSGIITNTILPTGVYFYVINFNRSNKAPLQGQVYLKR